MSRITITSLLCVLVLHGCAANKNQQGTLAELESVNIELVDTKVEGGLEKAMQSYQKFLEQTPESAMTPEAIRRLADLKVEKEYGVISGDVAERDIEPKITTKAVSSINSATKSKKALAKDKNKKVLEEPASKQQKIAASNKNIEATLPSDEAENSVEGKGAEEAIVLYRKLLQKYPLYDRNDQVLYQLSRAHEEIGQVDEAMQVMNRLYKQFPTSRYLDEVHFRRGEYYFTRKKYLDAEEAYDLVLKFGISSVYYERALFKIGWAFYKQELYEDAITRFLKLLDYKVSIGYDFEQVENKIEKKRIDDTFHVVSLAFSNLGGATSVQDYFDKNGSRSYEHNLYRNLGEFYFSKRRYSDAASIYDAFIERNPFHKVSPHFSMRVIEIYQKGGFPRLVIKGKKQFSQTYGLTAEYWNYFNKSEYPDVLGYLKSNIFDLANHYHSLYQKKRFSKNKVENFSEAKHWYSEYLKSFPKDVQTPKINFQYSDLLMENKDFRLAAIEYERTAYDYPVNPNSSKAGYSAVYAYREYLKVAPTPKLGVTKRDIVRSSLRMIDAFPKHKKATIVLGAAVDDLFGMRDFELAVKIGRRLIDEYPKAKKSIRRGAWLVVAHSSFDLERFSDAETAYISVLKLLDQEDKSRVKLTDNLAASIYKQGEQAKAKGEFKVAVKHFLRIAMVAPKSEIRQAAEYDAAAVLIQIKDLDQAVTVLLAFRENYPGHKLQKDVTKKIAFAYKELDRFALAAVEFESIARDTDQEELIRDALLIAADMYDKDKDIGNTLRLYKEFVERFPRPIEFALETHNKIALIYKGQKDLEKYHDTLRLIISIDANAKQERTDRTRYLGATASLVLIEPDYEKYAALKLLNPLKRSIAKKKKSMKHLVKRFAQLVDYKVADVTAASTFYLAEIYYNFNRALMESERPKKLSELELEEFALAVEEQAYPFEEKSIGVHEKNVELLGLGIYSKWIDRSIEKLAKLMPARYAKSEQSSGFISKIDFFNYIPKHIQIVIAEAKQAEIEKQARLKRELAEKIAREKAALARAAAKANSATTQAATTQPATTQEAPSASDVTRPQNDIADLQNGEPAAGATNEKQLTTAEQEPSSSEPNSLTSDDAKNVKNDTEGPQSPELKTPLANKNTAAEQANVKESLNNEPVTADPKAKPVTQVQQKSEPSAEITKEEAVSEDAGSDSASSKGLTTGIEPIQLSPSDAALGDALSGVEKSLPDDSSATDVSDVGTAADEKLETDKVIQQSEAIQ